MFRAQPKIALQDQKVRFTLSTERLFTKLTLCSQIRNIVLKFLMNLIFIYLGEECLVIIYSASELAMGIIDVILQPENQKKISRDKNQNSNC